MNRREKEETVRQLHLTFKELNHVFLVEFRGLKVVDDVSLRRKVKEVASDYQVVKNTLALRAIEDTPLEGLQEEFAGPTAIAYTRKDPMVLAKVLLGFVTRKMGLRIKKAVVDGELLTAEEVKELASLPPKGELIGKLVSVLKSPLGGLLSYLQTPISNFICTIDQIRLQKGHQQEP